MPSGDKEANVEKLKVSYPHFYLFNNFKASEWVSKDVSFTMLTSTYVYLKCLQITAVDFELSAIQCRLFFAISSSESATYTLAHINDLP